jgi:hypothetical protein
VVETSKTDIIGPTISSGEPLGLFDKEFSVGIDVIKNDVVLVDIGSLHVFDLFHKSFIDRFGFVDVIMVI